MLISVDQYCASIGQLGDGLEVLLTNHKHGKGNIS